jgi:hypothetical protein
MKYIPGDIVKGLNGKLFKILSVEHNYYSDGKSCWTMQRLDNKDNKGKWKWSDDELGRTTRPSLQEITAYKVLYVNY